MALRMPCDCRSWFNRHVNYTGCWGGNPCWRQGPSHAYGIFVFDCIHGYLFEVVNICLFCKVKAGWCTRHLLQCSLWMFFTVAMVFVWGWASDFVAFDRQIYGLYVCRGRACGCSESKYNIWSSWGYGSTCFEKYVPLCSLQCIFSVRMNWVVSQKGEVILWLLRSIRVRVCCWLHLVYHTVVWLCQCALAIQFVCCVILQFSIMLTINCLSHRWYYNCMALF
jgi:hypothetical protein